MSQPQISIVMGSDSDLKVMKEAAEILEKLEVPFEISIISAHRTPEKMFEYAKSAAERGIQVIIAGAGGAAHLPGMIASVTPLPVIGVPIRSSNSIDGWDSLLSIVQMPAGVPVATVAVNGAVNAGILSAQILSVRHDDIRHRITSFKNELSEKVAQKAAILDEKGYKNFKK